MSFIAVDNYFPFTDGAGANATATRWRLMARNWVQGGSGIIQGYLNQFNPTIAGSTVTVDTGAAWLDGFYGEVDAPKTVTAAVNGMIVVQMDPVAEVVNIAFKSGQTQAVQSPTGIFEIPIAQVTAGALTDVRQFVITTATTLIPTGVMVPFAGLTGAAPVGWLFCDGRAVSRLGYPALATLFQTAGFPYGSGDGSTTFNLPDTRSRLLVGAAPTSGLPGGLTQRLLGSLGGEENHVMTLAEAAPHQHSTENVPGIQPPANGGWLAYRNDAGANGLVANPLERVTFTSGVNSNTVGGGAGHNNMPPFIAINHIIKT